MSCDEIESAMVDMARGVLDPVRGPAVRRHVQECSQCAARLQSESALSTALRQLASSIEDIPPDPVREAAMLAAFDQAWQRPHLDSCRNRRDRMLRRCVLAAAAVLLAIGGAAGLRTALNSVRRADVARSQGATSTPRGSGQVTAHLPAHDEPAVAVPPRRRIGPRRVAPVSARVAPEFVPLPGVATLPPFESGELVRLNLPVSVLPVLGVSPPPSSDIDSVRADVLIGQDGFPRAVRLVP